MSRMLERRMGRARLPGLLVAVALVVSACSSSGDAAPPDETRTTASPLRSSAPSAAVDPPSYASYVALGDSSSAGPLIPTAVLAGGYTRSDHKYPSLVAQRFGVR